MNTPHFTDPTLPPAPLLAHNLTPAEDIAGATKSSFQSNKSSGRGDRGSGSINSSLKRGEPSTETIYKEHKVAEWAEAVTVAASLADTRDSATTARFLTT